MLAVHVPGHDRHAPATEVVMGRAVPAYEVPARADRILAALREGGHEILEPADHGRDPLLRVHDLAYLEHLERAWSDWVEAGGRGPLAADTFALDRTPPPPTEAEARAGYYAFDASTPILEHTYEVARLAADAALTGAHHLLGGERHVYALCRPPGHHAGRDFAGGYCYLNNAAAAASLLASEGGGAAILDLDYHHGNGTQQVFWDDPAVLFASLHADPDVEYPYYTGRAGERGGAGAPGATLNVPLPLGTADGPYLAALEGALERVHAHDPGAVVVSLGLDGYEGDPMGRFALSADAYGALARAVARLDRPTLVVQEGGYAVESLGGLVLRFLSGLTG